MRERKLRVVNENPMFCVARRAPRPSNRHRKTTNKLRGKLRLSSTRTNANRNLVR